MPPLNWELKPLSALSSQVVVYWCFDLVVCLSYCVTLVFKGLDLTDRMTLTNQLIGEAEYPLRSSVRRDSSCEVL